MAGLDTVTTGLTLAFAYLARHPLQRQELVDDPSLIPSAVEELLRISTPAPALSRRATRDIELHGITIREGESIYCHLGAANGDPARTVDAERVDFHRTANPHSSFGGGIHRCLGSHLARLEIRLVVEEFHKRIPHYELAPGAELLRVPFFEGLDSLQIAFSANVGPGRASAD